LAIQNPENTDFFHLGHSGNQPQEDLANGGKEDMEVKK
jgi:hypothetical protein